MKRKLLILGAFLSFLLSGCSYELELPHPSEAETLANFGITDARHYFEQNADNLAPLRLSPETKSQSELLSHLELTPEWDKAMQSGHKGVSLIEVPIQSNSILQTSEKFIRNGKVVFRKLFPITRRLIVARRNTGETEMFVATIIPTIVGGRNVMKSVENFRYLGGGDFTGKVFCSTLEGEFVKAFGYTDGQMNGTLAVMKKRQLQEHGEESWAQEYTTVSFSEAVKTSASTYTFDEGWIGGGGNKCPHGMNEKDCPHCLDEVIVTACPYCHVQGGCICSKCFYCFNREQQCTCPKCTQCHKKIQECTCYYYPDPDPHPGGGSGGSSTGGNNGGTTEGEDIEVSGSKHTINKTDVIGNSKVLNLKRRRQRGNTCVQQVMEYINRLLDLRDGNNRRTYIRFFEEIISHTNKEEDCKIKWYGTPTQIIPKAIINFFGNGFIGNISYGNNAFDYKACINDGSVIMTNIHISNNMWHNILIIGYTKQGNYIYIDPNDNAHYYVCSPRDLQSDSSYKYNIEIIQKIDYYEN